MNTKTPARRVTPGIWRRSFLSLLAGAIAVCHGGTSGAQSLSKRGEYLARAGDCIDCHTAPDGKLLAGGRSISTPFGSMVTPNITPDKETGIGAWNADEFYRALHDGIGRNGEYLYPVFPFVSYTKVSREDVDAIRAYLMSVPAVHAKRNTDTLEFPFNVRSSLAVWRELYFKAGVFQPDPHRSAALNRGGYLVEGLGHCGECHTPRNSMGAAKDQATLQGGAVQGWYAPNITADVRQGIGAWSDAQLKTFLKTGSTPGKGVAIGPMNEVVQSSLRFLTDADLTAMVAYLKSTAAAAQSQETVALPSPGSSESGGALYLDYCASCHQLDGRGVAGAIPSLVGNGAVLAAGADNVLSAVFGGLPATGSGPIMPAFGADLSDEQIAAVTDYVRTAWSNRAIPNADPHAVADLRKQMPVTLAEGRGYCLPMPDTPLSHKLADPTAGIATLMDQVTESNVIAQSRAILAIARKIDSTAERALLVNDLSSLYCQRLQAASEVTPLQKRNRYYRFGRVIYQQLGGGG